MSRLSLFGYEARFVNRHTSNARRYEHRNRLPFDVYRFRIWIAFLWTFSAASSRISESDGWG